VSRAIGAALLGVLLLLAAATFDSVSLYVPGVGLLLLGAGALAWVTLATRGASVERETGPATVQEEEPYAMRIAMRTGLMPAPGGELRDALLDRALPLAGRRSLRVRVNVRFGSRGRRVLEPSTLVLADPLRLAWRELRSPAAEVLVLPRVEPVLAAGAGGGGRAGIESGRLGATGAELELDALRPYRPGAPASRIHWPTVARSGKVMERRLVSDADGRPLVVLDPRGFSSDDLDRAARATASLIVHLAGAGGVAVLMPGDRRAVDVDADLRAWPALHARLALIDDGAGAPTLRNLNRGGPLFWVASGGEPPIGLRRAGTAARYLVTPAAVNARLAPAFTVAGCHGYRLGRPRTAVAA